MLSLVIGASRRGSTGGSAFVRAFCPRTSSVLSGNTKSAYRVTGARAPTVDWSSFSTSSQKDGLKISSTVDDDLDAALDSILGDAISKIDDSMDSTSIPPPQKNKLASTLVEEENPEDFNDPAYLSTTAPHWIEYGMSSGVIDVLSGKGITTLTPVQAEAFKPILAGRDVIGRSRTGTGKTLAFGMPAMQRLVDIAAKKGIVDSNGRRRRGRNTSMIVLVPTRELSRQVGGELAEIGKPLGLYVSVFHGGVSYDPQARDLNQGIDVLVGTPGRIIDHIQRGNLDLSQCDVVVLDEADEMLNMGFADDVETILDGVGSTNELKTQCLLFSATTPPWVKDIGRSYQSNVISIDATSSNEVRTATTVRHTAVQVPPGMGSKKAILEDIIAVEISKDMSVASAADEVGLENNPIAAAAAAKKKKGNNAMQQKIFGKTIVFTETKRDADDLVSGSVFKSLTAQVCIIIYDILFILGIVFYSF